MRRQRACSGRGLDRQKQLCSVFWSVAIALIQLKATSFQGGAAVDGR
ncbi:MAG: hypothetical protein ACLU4P_09690 [Ruminococcus sp.]